MLGLSYHLSVCLSVSVSHRIHVDERASEFEKDGKDRERETPKTKTLLIHFPLIEIGVCTVSVSEVCRVCRLGGDLVHVCCIEWHTMNGSTDWRCGDGSA